MITLIALGLMVAVFAFTLGIHLGKRVKGGKAATEVAIDPAQVPTLQDSVPNKQELAEQAKGAQAAADEELSQTLRAKWRNPESSSTRLARFNFLKIQSPRTVVRPPFRESRGRRGRSSRRRAAESKRSASDLAKYTLQVGSYPTEDEAQEQVDSLRAHGLRPFLR